MEGAARATPLAAGPRMSTRIEESRLLAGSWAGAPDSDSAEPPSVAAWSGERRRPRAAAVCAASAALLALVAGAALLLHRALLALPHGRPASTKEVSDSVLLAAERGGQDSGSPLRGLGFLDFLGSGGTTEPKDPEGTGEQEDGEGDDEEKKEGDREGDSEVKGGEGDGERKEEADSNRGDSEEKGGEGDGERKEEADGNQGDSEEKADDHGDSCEEDKYQQEVLKKISEAFDKVGSNPTPGGILVVMLDGRKVQDWTEFSLANVASQGCAPLHRKTCVLAHYLRKDLAPVVLSNPGHRLDKAQGSNPRVGLVLDADKAFELITGMFVVDGDAYARSACSNEVGYMEYEFPTHPLEDEALNESYDCSEAFDQRESWPEDKKGWCCAHKSIACPDGMGPDFFDCAAGLPKAKTGWSVTKKDWCCINMNICLYDSEPYNCMWLQAHKKGFDIERAIRAEDDEGSPEVGAECSNEDERCKLLNSGGGLSQNKFGYVEACQNPKDPNFNDMMSCFSFEGDQVRFDGECPACSTPFVCVAEDTPDKRATFSYDAGDNEWQAFTGTGGRKWTDIFMHPLMSYNRTNEGQCKWKRDSFDTFVKVTKDAQKEMLKMAKRASDFPGKLPRRGYLWADPASRIAVETEVGLYTNPNTESAEYKYLNQKFRDAIIGVTVDDRTCQEQLAWLCEDEYTVVSSDDNEYNDAEGRCNALLQGAPEPEDVEIEAAREGAKHLSQLLSASYGSSEGGKPDGEPCVLSTECVSGLTCMPEEHAEGTPMWRCQAMPVVLKFTPSTSLAPEPLKWEEAFASKLSLPALFTCGSYTGTSATTTAASLPEPLVTTPAGGGGAASTTAGGSDGGGSDGGGSTRSTSPQAPTTASSTSWDEPGGSDGAGDGSLGGAGETGSDGAGTGGSDGASGGGGGGSDGARPDGSDGASAGGGGSEGAGGSDGAGDGSLGGAGETGSDGAGPGGTDGASGGGGDGSDGARPDGSDGASDGGGGSEGGSDGAGDGSLGGAGETGSDGAGPGGSDGASGGGGDGSDGARPDGSDGVSAGGGGSEGAGTPAPPQQYSPDPAPQEEHDCFWGKQEEWPQDKAEWCCANKGKGCTMQISR